MKHDQLTVRKWTDFGELKAGDKFLLNGLEYEKISGNMADIVGSNPIKCVEIQAETEVFLTELG